MKWIIVFLMVGMIVTGDVFARGNRRVRVKSYVKKDGIYVGGYVRTGPNKTKADNWSTQGNINPYTGKNGEKRE